MPKLNQSFVKSAAVAPGELQGRAFKTRPDSRSAEKVELIEVKLPSWLSRPYREISQDDVLARFDVVSRMLPKRRLSKTPQPITRACNHRFKYLQAAFNY